MMVYCTGDSKEFRVDIERQTINVSVIINKLNVKWPLVVTSIQTVVRSKFIV